MAIYWGNQKVNVSGIQNAYVGSQKVYEAYYEVPNYLCFTANKTNSNVELLKVGSPSIANTAYSRDGRTWTTFTPGTSQGTNRIILQNIGDKVYFRNDITGNFSSSNYLNFITSGNISASGNVNSMYASIDFESITTLTYTYCYYHMFYGCNSLVEAPELPATTLSDYCYVEMFNRCTSLTETPELPATTLSDYCYYYMFYYCSSLRSVSYLPATTLTNFCYYRMFYGCTSLVNAPEILATTLAPSCCVSMFSSCTSLKTSPTLLSTSVVSSCYSSMFYGCTSLTTVPTLPATTLAQSCYSLMFCGCTSLQVSDTQTTDATYAWTIPESGTFTNTYPYNQHYMFEECLGTRSSDDMSGAYGESHTYYTQNQPV